MDSGRSYALTFARLVLGVTALAHGIADTFGIWGGPHLHGTSSDMAMRGTVSADWMFYTVSVGLIVVGLGLVLGMFCRAGALAVLVVVVWHGFANARFTAFFAHDNGCEVLLALAALCAVVATHGAGAFKVELKSGGKK